MVAKFAPPIRGPFAVSQWFGNGHKGIDIAVPVGRAVVASGQGVVSRVVRCTKCTAAAPSFPDNGIPINDPTALADVGWGFGFGNFVVVKYAWDDLPDDMRAEMIRIGRPNVFAYVIHAHLSRNDIVVNTPVADGTPLGLSGNTGNSTGPHLHLEVRISERSNAVSTGGFKSINPTFMYDIQPQAGVERSAMVEGLTAMLSGIDVSHHNGSVNWAKVKAAGVDFAFAKATEGTHFTDSKFADNWQAMKVAGIIRGAYHYLRALQDATDQAHRFLQVAAIDAGDLPPVLDIERTFNTSASSAEFIQSAKTWLNVVRAQIGRTPIIYTAPSFWNRRMSDEFGEFPLWVANYEVNTPTIPKGWNSWCFWQHTDKGQVNGVSGNVDLDKFNGTRDQLQAFIAAH
jgi:lysozyme